MPKDAIHLSDAEASAFLEALRKVLPQFDSIQSAFPLTIAALAKHPGWPYVALSVADQVAIMKRHINTTMTKAEKEPLLNLCKGRVAALADYRQTTEMTRRHIIINSALQRLSKKMLKRLSKKMTAIGKAIDEKRFLTDVAQGLSRVEIAVKYDLEHPYDVNLLLVEIVCPGRGASLDTPVTISKAEFEELVVQFRENISKLAASDPALRPVLNFVVDSRNSIIHPPDQDWPCLPSRKEQEDFLDARSKKRGYVIVQPEVAIETSLSSIKRIPTRTGKRMPKARAARHLGGGG